MKGCLYLNWKSKNLTTTMDKINEKIFSCSLPLSPLSQCCVNPKSHWCTSKVVSPVQHHWKGGRGEGVWKICVIFLKNPFSWQCNDLGQKCIILRPSCFLIGSNAPLTEKVKRTYASWLPSQHPAMLRTIEKEGTSVKSPICGNWNDRIKKKGWVGLDPSQDLASNFKFPSADMGNL